MSGDTILLIPIFFTIAVLYSAAGLGGGSSYLAVLSIFSLEFVSLRIIALLCNIVVVSNSTFLFAKNGFLNIRKALPLIALSVPFAYLGGRIQIEEGFFFKLLGFTLLLAACLMLISKDISKRAFPRFANAGIGGGIGFLSGMVGIGGGIFLSPILHLSKWNTPKIIAASTAAFILFNSLAGLLGQIQTNQIVLDIKLTLSLVVAVLVGGQIGSRLSISVLSHLLVKRVTAVLILIVAIRLLLIQYQII